jgi:hypothetical protein
VLALSGVTFSTVSDQVLNAIGAHSGRQARGAARTEVDPEILLTAR